MAPRTIITLGYILAFWGFLPGALAALAAWGQTFFGPRLRLPGLQAPGLVLAAVAGIMLIVSIFQYTQASGSLPISAFPPRKLIRSGTLGVWRHPIYLFAILFFSGLGVAAWPTGFLLVAFPVLVLGTVLYTAREETELEKRFGKAYQGHRLQTSILVPRFWHCMRLVGASVCRLFFRFRVLGRENAGIEPPYFVISAHRNYLDPVFVSLAVGVPVHFITTSERFRSFPSRSFIKGLYGFPKKRYVPDVRHALEIRRRLTQGCIVGVFPEAERSWTGAMLPFKPSSLKLLRSLSEVPILPVRVQGAYEAWPRWAAWPRRAKVTASIGRPVFATPGESMTAFAARIRSLIEPTPDAEAPARRIRARGIEALIYRCPECLSFDTVRSAEDGSFGCARCEARFELRSNRSVRKLGQADPVPLADVAERIFAGPDVAIPSGDAGGHFVAGGVFLAVETGGRFRTRRRGRLELTATGLDFNGPGGTVLFDLDTMRAVLIEGTKTLQIYGGRPAVLSRLTLADQSALKWQHLIANAVRSVRGKLPDTA